MWRKVRHTIGLGKRDRTRTDGLGKGSNGRFWRILLKNSGLAPKQVLPRNNDSRSPLAENQSCQKTSAGDLFFRAGSAR
jgi:hypothetical protein